MLDYSGIHVMYLNPVGNGDFDQTFADMIATYKYPQTTAYVTSFRGDAVPAAMNNLEYRAYESLTISETVKAARYCSRNGIDALVIGCFYDPALEDARELADNAVVVAPCESAIDVALKVSNRFSIIIGQDKWEDQMKQTVHRYGYRDQLASFQSVGLRVVDFHKDPEVTKEKLQAAAMTAVTQHKAESIILGCTLEVGYFTDLQEYLMQELGAFIPVIDSSIAAFKAGEHAAMFKAIGWKNSRLFGMQPPPEAELKQFNLFQRDIEFGNEIVIPPSNGIGA